MTRVDERFAAVAARTPDAIAVQDREVTLTYGELDRRSGRLAGELRRQGIGRGALVAVLMDRGVEQVVSALAVLRAGAAYLPIDPALPAARVGFFLDDSGASLVVTLRRWRGRLPGNPVPVCCLDDDPREPAAPPDPGTAAGDDDLAYLMYTSGSTGQPNGSRIPHRAVVGLVCDTDYVRFGPADRVAHVTNVGFDPAVFEIWGALLNGARLVVLPPERVLDPYALAADLRAHRITVLWLTAGLFNMVAAAVPDAFGGLTSLLVGGEQVDAHWIRRVLAAAPPRRLLNAYGPTETTTFAAWHLVREVPPQARTVPIGGPIAGARLYLLDGDQRPVPPGATGELYIGGAGVGLGYHRRPALTAARFLPDPYAAVPGATMFRTGDLGRQRPDGAIEFLGRRDRQIKLHGVRVEPGEIEAVLHTCPGVRQSVVAPYRDPAAGTRLVAYVVPEPVADDTVQERTVQRWRELYDEVIYDRIADADDPTFNLASWVSSYTGLPLPAEAMREQVTQTAERLLALRPRRVLDLGCGTGLLLFRVAPHCTEYVATDFSAVAVRHLRARVAEHRPPLPQVRVEHRAADDFSGLAPGDVDTVLISSVTQHFPSADYLLRVLSGAAGVVRPGGWIYVADVRSLPLLEAFHASVALYRAAADTPAAEVRRSQRQSLHQEQELVLDPRFFTALPGWDPRFRAVHVRLKRGRHANELTRFRYDVLLRVGEPAGPSPDTVEPVPRTWRGLPELAAALREHPRPAAIRVRGVPNARVSAAAEAARLLAGDPPGTAAELRSTVAARTHGHGVDPETLWELGERLSWRAEVCWSPGGEPDTCDVVFHDAAAPPDAVAHRGPADPRAYANSPRLALSTGELIAGLRRSLRERLPDALVPSAFVVLDRLPLTPHGKVDHAALPPPAPPPAQPRRHVAARGSTEQAVATAFARALGMERVGATDNFFDLGGTSLAAAQVAAELRRDLGADVSVVHLFDTPTARGLASAVDGAGPRGDATDREWARGRARRDQVVRGGS